jgi:hypothetical protein
MLSIVFYGYKYFHLGATCLLIGVPVAARIEGRMVTRYDKVDPFPKGDPFPKIFFSKVFFFNLFTTVVIVTDYFMIFYGIWANISRDIYII